MAAQHALAFEGDNWAYRMDHGEVGKFIQAYADAYAQLDQILAFSEDLRATPPFTAIPASAADLARPELLTWDQLACLAVIRARWLAETRGLDAGLSALAAAWKLEGLYRDAPGYGAYAARLAIRRRILAAARGLASLAAAAPHAPRPVVLRQLSALLEAAEPGAAISAALQGTRAEMLWSVQADSAWPETLLAHGLSEKAQVHPAVFDRPFARLGILRAFDMILPSVARFENDVGEWSNRRQLRDLIWALGNEISYDRGAVAELGDTPGAAPEMRYGPYAAEALPDFSSLMGRALLEAAERRLVAAGLLLWADTLERRRPSEIPINPMSGQPFRVETETRKPVSLEEAPAPEPARPATGPGARPPVGPPAGPPIGSPPGVIPTLPASYGAPAGAMGGARGGADAEPIAIDLEADWDVAALRADMPPGESYGGDVDMVVYLKPAG